MPAPYDYTIQAANPLLSGLKGYEMAQMQRQRAMAIEQQKQAMAQEEQMRQRQAEYQQAQAQLAQNPNATAQDYIKLQGMFPEKAAAIKEMNAQRSETQLQGDLNIMQKVNTALSAGKNDTAIEYLNIYSSALKNSGRQDQAQSIDNIAEMAKDHPEAVKTELYQQLLANWGPEKFTEYFRQQQALGGVPKVVRSEIFPDGTTLSVMSVGAPVITSPDGIQLTGEQAAQAIRNAQDYGSTLAKEINYNRQQGTLEAQEGLKSKIAGEVKSAENAEKTRQEFFDKYEKIQANIRTLDEAEAIIGRGIQEGKDLGVGPIRRLFPAWGATANELKNVASRLGLDVISSVTFGALSEKELEVATQTAMPTTLKGDALLQWIKDRKAAQEKLSDYLSKAANFIGSPKEGGGVNTATDWMQIVQSKKRQAGLPTINSQAEYDALESGAEFIDAADGKRYRKP